MLTLLRQALPRAEIMLVGSAWAEELLPMVPGRFRFFPFDSPSLLPLFTGEFSGENTHVFERADAVLVYAEDISGPFVRNVGAVCRGEIVAHPVTPRPGVHAAEHFAAALMEGGGCEGDIPPPALRVETARLRWARRWLAERLNGRRRCVVAIHPGSGGGRKCWPAERFACVIDSLTEAGAGCLLIEGPADSHECAKVRSALKDEGPVAFVRRADLASIAALIASCRAYVGNDSGVTHLAAALGVCVVAVFGATDPLVWGPLGTCVAVVSARRRGRNGADDWPTEGDVFAALRDFGVFG